MGSLIKSEESYLKAGLYKKQFNLNNMASGLYFLKISTPEGFAVEKIMIE
jgi:hypothetical protein